VTESIIVQELYKSFPKGAFQKEPSPVLKGLSFTVQSGGIFGLIGPSGSGKSTAAKICAGLLVPDSGAVRVQGPAGFVSQDPYQSLAPFLRIEQIVAEPLLFSKKRFNRNERRELVEAALAQVRLDYAGYGKRLPSELSGGERQRAAIARAIVAKPRVLILDEPASMLDYDTKTEILTVLAGLKQHGTLSMLLISHDIALIKTLCSEIGVIQNGRIIEYGNTKTIFSSPVQVLTKKLIFAASDLQSYWDLSQAGT
jgi:ABC-type glutathione transport system ATPase component